ncbi:MAG: patatin-like phospholipase family protein [Geothrix sp.]|nr:patatin-like phospholipase family protein [Geothrix sp.]
MTRCHFAAAPSGQGPRRALLLAGGGMRVAWQAGVLLALDEAGLRFHHLDGASGGTLNLAMLLSGLSPAEMAHRWRALDLKDFISLLPLEDYLKGAWPAMGDADGLKDKVFPGLGIDFDSLRTCEGVSATFNLCNFTRKTLEAVDPTAMAPDLLVAALSLPAFMPAVSWKGMTYTDAAWIKDANLWESVKRGAEELWLLWCIGNTPTYRDGAFPQYVHMIEMSANGALFEELDRIRDLNERIQRGDSPFGQRQPVRLHVIKPTQALPLDPDFYLGRVRAESLIALGHRAATDYLNDRSPAGLPLTPEITTMTDAAPGLSFRETMDGPFSLGATDPGAGAAGDAPTLAMHATVFVQDLDRFLSDPTHLGSLSGTIDYGPFGAPIEAHHGVFRLFSPADEPDTRHMVYELAFEKDGEPHYLAGHKVVRQDPGFDLWKDTTTLYTTLHRGSDARGEIIGAGILSLGVTDLIRLLGTVEVPNAGPAQRMEALAKFGKFFMGELWNTYAKHLG